MNRRTFLQSSAALAAIAPAGLLAAEKKRRSNAQEAARGPVPFKPSRTTPRAHKKGFMFSTLRSSTAQKMSKHDKFQLLKNAGFEGVEVPGADNQKEVLAARDAFGLEIPSVLMPSHWSHPLSDPNPATREVSVNNLKISLQDAKAYGARSVLLVPAVVNKQISYADAHKRSIEEIKKCVPLAEKLGIAIALENVWNSFLLSPIEAAEYCDVFKSPMVRWHFDVGNVVNFGWPEHWIRILRERIVTVHVKEYSRALRDEHGPKAGFQAEYFTGDSDWPTVMAAFDDVHYPGWLIAEHTYRAPGMDDATWLRNIVVNMDKMLVA